MIGRSVAGPWHSPSISHSSFKPPRGSLRSTAFGQQCQKGQQGPSAGASGKNEKQPSAPSECSIHRSRQTGTAARWDGQRTKGVLLLIDCKISRASQWDQHKTAADGAGPDTLAERALPTC
ncbi:hypothetical protein QQF64_009373 [Cirrhinus molitorella]|uniref:Uncharacterized protein n=1 Tax=Cirrhinus molitorella TaxID=172907 RepID=A0ABR3M3E7_9TELE